MSVGIAVLSQKPAKTDQLLFDNMEALSKSEDLELKCDPASTESCGIFCPYCCTFYGGMANYRLVGFDGICPDPNCHQPIEWSPK